MAQGFGSMGNAYNDMRQNIERKSASENLVGGLAEAAGQLPQDTFAGGLLSGLANGAKLGIEQKANTKRDKVMEALMAKQEEAMTRQQQVEEMADQVAMMKGASEARTIMQDNIDLSLDAYESTGDLSMLNETLSNEKAGPLRKLFENQVAQKGGLYQGITATPQGDLMPFGLAQDGTRVYGEPFPAKQGYSQGYLTAKQAKDLDARKAQAELEKVQAQTATEEAQAGKYNAEAARASAATGETQTITQPDGSVVQTTTPAGITKPIPAELAARLGLAQDALTKLPSFIESAKSGKLTGPVDYANGALGRGEQGTQYREVAAGAEALTRMLTGAGMNIAEAEREASLYLPTWKDNAETVANKAEQLQRRLESVVSVAMAGRGALPQKPADKLNTLKSKYGLE